MPVNLRLLRYVVAVADEGTFQRAAEKLHMAQPPLSRQIGGLERELGVKLFERNPTRPTAAGVQFVSSARRVLAAAEQLVRDVTAAPGHRVTGKVRVAYLPATGLDTMPLLVEAVRTRHPGIEVDAFDKWSPERLVPEGDAELALTRCAPYDPLLMRQTVRRERLLALLPGSHELAARTSITLRDLRGHTFCYFPRRRAPDYYDKVLAALQSTGETFMVWENPIPNDVLNFTVIPSSTAPHVPEGLAVVPFADELPAIDLELVWNPHTVTRATEAVIDVIMTVARDEGWLTGP